MPELSRFLGIIIYMYVNDHLPSHFHAKYGEYEITIEIETGIITGTFPRRALTAVLDWYTLHIDELRNNWKLAMQHKPLSRIDPLE